MEQERRRSIHKATKQGVVMIESKQWKKSESEELDRTGSEANKW